MSRFVSTRSGAFCVDSKNAMIRGLAPDGGLYAPVEIPKLDYKMLKGLSYSELAARIVHTWFDDLGWEEIVESCAEAYGKHFDTPLVAPVVKAADTYIVELFHGETCAFKDVALPLLPRLLVKSRSAIGLSEKVLILTATSGDTGSAAMNGFKNVPDTGMITFFPNGGVSPLQRRQMVCIDAPNVTACAVNGNFDDCQSAVKRAFAELPKIDGISFSSANSINIARLVPQIGYYYSTYLTLLQTGEIREGETISFVVPTGNFGDILAGCYAKRMGLPIGRLVCASNANNVLTDFINTGIYDRRRDFLKTLSPSMDILISSNLERLIYYAQDEDSALVSRQMEELKTKGIYSVSSDTLSRIRKDFSAYCFDDAETIDTIRNFYNETGYLADPHTAVALSAQRRYVKENPGEKCAVLSTASPFKFVSCIAEALNVTDSGDPFDTMRRISDKTGLKAPEYLSALESRDEKHKDTIDRGDIIDYILGKYPALF